MISGPIRQARRLAGVTVVRNVATDGLRHGVSYFSGQTSARYFQFTK
jgi:hypothetical protein